MYLVMRTGSHIGNRQRRHDDIFRHSVTLQDHPPFIEIVPVGGGRQARFTEGACPFYREADHTAREPRRFIVPASHRALEAYREDEMKSVNELLKLFMRQAELESAMRRPGGARVIEEQELHAVRQRVAGFPEAMRRELSTRSAACAEDARAVNSLPSQG
jgi:hypothetical protein